MKSKAIRKSVSAFLCIAMLFALIPAFAIGAGAEEEVPLSGAAVTYDFRIRAYPGDAGQTIAYFQDYTQYRKWAYAGWGGSFTYSSGLPDRWHSMRFLYWQWQTNENAWVALKINVPAAGRYNARFSYCEFTTNGIIGFYMVPYTTEAAANPEAYAVPGNKLFEFDAYGTTNNDNVTVEKALPDMSFDDEGDYLLIMRADGKNTKSNGYYMRPSTITLDGMEYSAAKQTLTFKGSEADVRGLTSYAADRQWAYYDASFSAPIVRNEDGLQAQSAQACDWFALKFNIEAAGQYRARLKALRDSSSNLYDVFLLPFENQTTQQITDSLYSMVGSVIYIMYSYYIGSIDGNSPDPQELEYDMSDRLINEEGEYLLVFMLKQAGAGSSYMLPIEFTLDGLELSSVSLGYDKYEIEAGDTATPTLTALMNDGVTPVEGFSIDGYTSSNEAVATVDENGVVTGIAGGTADITVTITYDGVTVSDIKTITVSGAPALTSLTLISPPTKTVYKVGEELDLTGLALTGTFTDGTSGPVNVTADNISGFDSSTDNPSQEVTITVGGKTATFDVKVVRVLDSSYATGSITVDGNANEPAWSINHNIPANTGDNTATFGTLWDEDYLYVYVDVVDDVLVNNSNKHYYDDCVEIYIDGDMVKGEYNSHCAQYTFRYGDATKYVHPVSTASTDGVEHISRATESGYAVELKIPWSSIGGLTVEEGKTIGFTVHVNDKDTTDNPAGKEEDIIFYTVDSPNEDYQDSTNWAEMTLTAWQNPVEETESTGTVDIDTGGAPSNAITATVNGVPVDISNPGDLTLGDVVEMNADPEPEAGKKFLFWMDPVSNRLVSNQQEVTFTVGTNTQITAVYKDAGAGHIVIFFDRNGKVLSNEYLADGAAITAPETPYSVGYSFTGWSPTVPSVAKNDYAFIAQYEEEDVTYTVTVENGSISPAGGSYKYNTEVTVTAGSAGEGRKFAYWTKNGVIVSYSPNYSFYVWDDAEIRAVSVPISDNVTAAPAIYMDDNVKTASDGEFSRLIFASERTLPAGYTLIETGILVSDESDIDLDDYDKKAVAQSASGSGQFTARVDGLTAGATRYARAYMIYKIGGDYKVIYSNTVVGTV